jgi:penicillin-binding protein 2
MVRQPWHEREARAATLGEPLNGAAVVLDIAQGQVLAAVTVPGFTLRQLDQEPVEFWDSPWSRRNLPRIYRPVGMPYQPGSTVKPLVLAGACTDGHIGPGSTIECQGALDMSNPDRNRCWLFKLSMTGHRHLAGPEAIMRSCNVFFYTLGQRLGPQRLVWWYDRFNLGRPLGIELGEEHSGRLPDLRRSHEPNAPGFALHDAIQMGIGQGPIEWTPLQAANAYATLARGGLAIAPTFLLRPRDGHRPTGIDLGLNPHGVKMAMEGLDRGVNDSDGTSNHISLLGRQRIFNVEGVTIMGKSGTADSGPRWMDIDGDGHVDADDGEVIRADHAWFIGLVKRRGSAKPDFVIVVVVEYGGSGGAVAGPIANQILHAMRAEGYI